MMALDSSFEHMISVKEDSKRFNFLKETTDDVKNLAERVRLGLIMQEP